MADDLREWPELFCRTKVFFLLLELKFEVVSVPDLVAFLSTTTSMAQV